MVVIVDLMQAFRAQYIAKMAVYREGAMRLGRVLGCFMRAQARIRARQIKDVHDYASHPR